MTPKEKADQLTQRFYFSLPNNGSQTGINNVHNRWEEGKMCALMAVDEIMKAIGWDEMELGVDRDNYWTEVKQEIEKL
jgi:hypothetical protein